MTGPKLSDFAEDPMDPMFPMDPVRKVQLPPVMRPEPPREAFDIAMDELGPVQPAQEFTREPFVGMRYKGKLAGSAAKVPAPKTAADVLDEMAATFRERQKTYGSNYKMVAPIMEILFPGRLPEDLAFKHKFHLFELIIVKLSRFAISELNHQDSIHDLGVYAAMVEACLLEEKK